MGWCWWGAGGGEGGAEEAWGRRARRGACHPAKVAQHVEGGAGSPRANDARERCDRSRRRHLRVVRHLRVPRLRAKGDVGLERRRAKQSGGSRQHAVQSVEGRADDGPLRARRRRGDHRAREAYAQPAGHTQHRRAKSSPVQLQEAGLLVLCSVAHGIAQRRERRDHKRAAERARSEERGLRQRGHMCPSADSVSPTRRGWDCRPRTTSRTGLPPAHTCTAWAADDHMSSVAHACACAAWERALACAMKNCFS